MFAFLAVSELCPANCVFRLLLWYVAITAIFFCPASIDDLTDTSPKVCRPYLQLRDAAWPHAEPHYKAYLKPYVDRATPYAHKFHEQVYVPASSFAIDKYNVYGAPRVSQVWNYTEGKWEEVVHPQIEAGRKWTVDRYESTLAPHVNRAIVAAGPYYEQFKTGLGEAYESTATALVPVYESALPYFQRAYEQGHHVTTDIVLPYIYKAEVSTLSFWNRKIWPQLVILYGENVEPQLLRIKERLGRYKDGKKLEAAAESADADSLSTAASSSLSSAASSASSIASAGTGSEHPESAKPVETEMSEAEIREKIESDLAAWQKKFLKASDKGTEDLKERISEITDKQISFQAHEVGKAHLVKLEEVIDSATSNVKAKLISVVNSLPDDASEEDEDAAHKKIQSAIREQGGKIRTEALKIRDWKIDYDNETSSLVSAALQNTLDVMDSIRDLGLQEIGMRWAWMEGVTYKDWSRYHELKKTFDEWRNKIEDVATEHEGVAKAKEEGETIYDDGMEKASAAASELVRLHKVAEWKIAARDATDDFSDRVVPPRAAKKAQEVLDNVEEAVSDSGDKVSSVAAEASDTAGDVLSSLSSLVLGEEPTGTFEKAASSASSALVDAESAISSGSSRLSSSADEVAGTVLSAAKKKTDQASSAIIGTPAPVSEPVLSEASSSAESISSEISQAIPREEASSTISSLYSEASDAVPSEKAADMLDSMSSAASESVEAASSAIPTEEASSVASSASKKVFGGAMAAHVEAKQIVLDTPFDDEQSYSDAIASMISVAGEKASDLTKAISDAMVPTATSQETVESMTSLASEQYVKAMAAASSVLYGKEPGIFESLSSDLADRYLQAVTAYVITILPATHSTGYLLTESTCRASYAIYGTPTPVMESYLAKVTSGYSTAMSSISAMASSRLSQGLAFATAQFTSAKAAVGATPEPWHQQYLSEAQKRYYEGIGLAHDQYSSYVAAASSVIYGAPTPSYQLWASAVSESLFGTTPSAYESLMSAANAQYAAAVGVASQVFASATATSKPGYLEQASSAYDAAVSSASSYLSQASESASIAVYGTPQPTLQSLLSVAAEQYSDAMNRAAGKFAIMTSSSKRPAATFIEKANSQYSAAVESASSLLNDAWSSASIAVYGEPTPTLQAWANAARDWNSDTYVKASANWESLINAASSSIYGTPPPFTEAAWSSASSFHAQATSAAAEQYNSISSLFSELLVGREPDFTESVMSRLSSAYYTGAPNLASSASSYAADAYASASSVVSTIFTPPPTLEAILESVTEELDSAVSAASIGIYGTGTGSVESATSAAAEAVSSASSVLSEKIHGTEPAWYEKAQETLGLLNEEAGRRISEALFGTPTGTVESATSAAAEAYASVTSVVGGKVNSAIYGPEQGVFESATSRVAEAVESAKAALADLITRANQGGEDAQNAAASSIESAASSASSAASSLKDEL